MVPRLGEKNINKTKIIASLGPSSRKKEVVDQMTQIGVDVFRMNFSHGNYDDHKLSVSLVRDAEKRFNTISALMGDIQGPKIRVGSGLQVEVSDGEEILLTNKQGFDKFQGTLPKGIWVDYDFIVKEVKKGDKVLIDDGMIELIVSDVFDGYFVCKVVHGGVIKERKGVNLPYTSLSISSITEKDVNDINFCLEQDVDLIAQSFVRSAKDVKQVKDIILKHKKTVPVVAKIEMVEAIQNIDDIIDVSDAIIVARGDLGVEFGLNEVTLVQKLVVEKTRLAGKPVIVATQMLESMTKNIKPTRAEVADITNAILDGVDGLMVTGETAAGDYPVEVVKTLKNIITTVESSDIYKRLYKYYDYPQTEDLTESIAFAASQISRKLNTKYIVNFTQTGASSKQISKFRPSCIVISLSPEEQTLRKLKHVWGVLPGLVKNAKSTDEMLEIAKNLVKDYVSKGDSIVVTSGVPVGVSGSTNMLKVIEFE
ncbi:MAG: pyruvate kinase [Brevinematales bacterium]|nr:pyruvate kinase [Brevinematales bacterium]